MPVLVYVTVSPLLIVVIFVQYVPLKGATVYAKFPVVPETEPTHSTFSSYIICSSTHGSVAPAGINICVNSI